LEIIKELFLCFLKDTYSLLSSGALADWQGWDSCYLFTTGIKDAGYLWTSRLFQRGFLADSVLSGYQLCVPSCRNAGDLFPSLMLNK
jgi:hypothetical protein